MSSYVISCCSTADLTEEHFSKREISYICFHYKLNDTEYADDLGKSMPFDQFYAAMAAGAAGLAGCAPSGSSAGGSDMPKPRR